MENTKAFYDLCVSEDVKLNFAPFAKKCVEFGYKTIAINHILEQRSNVDNKSKKFTKKFNDDDVKNPLDVQKLLKDSDCQDLDLKVLTRLTIICKDRDYLFKQMKSDLFQKYHIFALIAKSNDVLQQACDSLDVEILSFDPLDIKATKLSRKLYNKAISRGIHFEINYHPAIQDQTMRRNIISYSHLYHQYGKSKNIIINSGCNSPTTLRGPYDIINLGLIFGLSEQQSKQAITTNSENVIKRAMGRRIGKAIVYVSSIKYEEIMDVDSDENVEPTQKKLKM